MQATSKNFFSYIRDGALILGIAILIPVTVMEINEIVAPTPSYSSIVTADSEKDHALYEEQVTTFEKTEKPNKRIRLFIYLVSGLLLLLAGFFSSILSIATGFILGGMLNIFFGIALFSAETRTIIKVGLLVLTITILLTLLYKLAQRE